MDNKELSNVFNRIEWHQLTTVERRIKILELEQKLLQLEKKQGVKIEAKVYSTGSIYAREIFIPRGAMCVGEIHIHKQINVVSQGAILVATEDDIVLVEAPSTFISKAGVKRAGFALEDTTWTTFLATDKVTDEEIYAEFIAPDFAHFDRLEAQ